MKHDLLETLAHGLTELKLTLSTDQQQQLIEFLLFLQKWNKAYNLTAIKDVDNMLTHHLLDSLSIAKWIKGDRILDVGTGAGFPGVPLAITYPQKLFTLLDSNGKKVRFLLQAKSEFKLDNVCAVQSRMEAFTSDQLFDVILSRAVGDIGQIIKDSSQLLADDGQWLFMKGTYPQGEIDDLQRQALTHKINVLKIEIPGVDAARHLVVVEKRKE